MMLIRHAGTVAAFIPFAIALLLSTPSVAQAPAPHAYTELPSETPTKFEAPTASFDYVKRNVMIAMRDGVKLNTVIIVPKGAKGAPILLTRTPYNANELTNHSESAHDSSQ